MASTYTMVAYGSQGSAVKQLQSELNRRGYSLDEDGIFGKKTRAAVRDYKPSLSLRDISPRGRDEFGLCAQVSKTQKLPREPCSQGSFVRYLGKADYSS